MLSWGYSHNKHPPPLKLQKEKPIAYLLKPILRRVGFLFNKHSNKAEKKFFVKAGSPERDSA